MPHDSGQAALVLQADPVSLSQVLSNALTSLAKYIVARRSIELASRRLRTELELSVRNTGIGIPLQARTPPRWSDRWSSAQFRLNANRVSGWRRCSALSSCTASRASSAAPAGAAHFFHGAAVARCAGALGVSSTVADAACRFENPMDDDSEDS
ncbi:ATP-binding protein [Azohydromonas australica]|uniref:ATP-binding protein n=1 Tax=Azohydromonas australica TaxID=364039 RepID=UPI0012EC2748|nr:ATP-binding protein [Azohydromonas australica]